MLKKTLLCLIITSTTICAYQYRYFLDELLFPSTWQEKHHRLKLFIKETNDLIADSNKDSAEVFRAIGAGDVPNLTPIRTGGIGYELEQRAIAIEIRLAFKKGLVLHD